MKRILKVLRDGLIIIVGVLVADFVMMQFIPLEWVDPVERAHVRDQLIYDLSVPYHHALKPNVGPMQRPFGNLVYPFQTDRYGFRTGECAGNDPVAQANSSVFVLGDSFAEGLGVPFEQTFAGLMACEWKKHGLTVWDLGVLSYSPSIYYYRILDSVKKLSLTPKTIFVFLDISDISDEALNYEDKDGRIVAARGYSDPFDSRVGGLSARSISDYIRRHFMTAALAWTAREWIRNQGGARVDAQRSLWTTNPEHMNSYGKRGLEKAAQYLDRIAGLCENWRCDLYLTVYPWPYQIANDSKDSIQVTYWRDWAKRRGVRFIDGFAPFFNEPKADALAKYIPGDVHFNAAGHKLLFDTVSREVWGAKP